MNGQSRTGSVEADRLYGINPRETGYGTIDFHGIFGNDRPLVLEIGSGKGRFLVESALEQPEKNFVGIEMSLHYARHIADRLARRQVPNARIINDDAAKVLERMIPDGTFSEVHVYFPDPWPRKKERKRRIIRDEVAKAIDRILTQEGWGVYVTDHRDYFEEAALVLERHFDVLEQGEASGTPRTNYEAKYREEGRPIYEVRFRKRS